MLLTVSTTHRPATDLGFLLHKNPGRVQTFSLAFGNAHVFYPEASEDRCTAALLLDVDPIALVRGRGSMLTDYVNDRPYVASSFLSVAIARVFGSALGGRSADRPELTNQALPLQAEVAALPCRGGVDIVRRLFEPLGYEVGINQGVDSGHDYCNLSLSCESTLSRLLTHLYVLIPVLDNRKHYWVGDAEVDKLVARGEGWLDSHPLRDLIVRRYLKHQRTLTGDALARLDDDSIAETASTADNLGSESIALADARLTAVVDVLKESGAARVLDLGCGEGRLVERLMADFQFQHILGVDVSTRALEIAARRLKLDRLPERQRGRVQLVQGAMTYRDRRLTGFDAVAVVEALEHLDPDRLNVFERVLFEFANPQIVIVTTPNREYNVKYPGIADGALRHPDHRFEWTRSEFAVWANSVAESRGYSVEFRPVGEEDEVVGSPTQMGIFRR